MADEKIRKALREALLEDVRTDTEMAQAGPIPPRWQADRLQELQDAVEKGLLTAQECADMTEKFRQAVANTPQISDEQFAAEHP